MNYKLTKKQAKEMLENKLLHFFGISTENATYEQYYKAVSMIVRDMMARECYESALIMHGGAIMMLLSSCAVPRKSMVEWTCPSGSGYSILVTPSLYHSSGVVEVIDYV